MLKQILHIVTYIDLKEFKISFSRLIPCLSEGINASNKVLSVVSPSLLGTMLQT